MKPPPTLTSSFPHPYDLGRPSLLNSLARSASRSQQAEPRRVSEWTTELFEVVLCSSIAMGAIGFASSIMQPCLQKASDLSVSELMNIIR